MLFALAVRILKAFYPRENVTGGIVQTFPSMI